MKDRRGVELKVGDVAVHATSGRYGAYDVVRIAGFTAKRVKVDQIDYMDPRQPVKPPRTDYLTILDPGTLIVAQLPPVTDRLS